jgi:VCBS repeat-containing protein
VPIGAADVDGDVLSYAVKAGTGPTKGSVTFFDDSFIYKPNVDATGADGFTILINDGVSAILEQAVTITINPVNDAALIGGVAAGSVTEDSGSGQIASGELTISDADGLGEQAFLPVVIHSAGVFTLSASGAWTYQLDNILPDVQQLDAGETLTDTITVQSVDGTTATVVITINGADEPISNGDAGGLLNGTAGADVIDAQGGTDVINAGAGNDIVLAGADRDLVHGGDGSDTINGGEGKDIVHGENGNDLFIATPGDGNDEYYGGDGVDTLDFSAFTTDVEVALGGGRSAGHAAGAQTGEDTILTIENVIGGSGNDNLRGGGSDNRLEGGAGDDFLYGSGGNDVLIGGTGDDTLVGSGHDDTFVFGPGFGRDTVVDFDDNARGSQDVLDISAFGITAADFFARVTITDIGNDTRITIDGNTAQRIVLDGVSNATRIGIDDFLLA